MEVRGLRNIIERLHDKSVNGTDNKYLNTSRVVIIIKICTDMYRLPLQITTCNTTLQNYKKKNIPYRLVQFEHFRITEPLFNFPGLQHHVNFPLKATTLQK